MKSFILAVIMCFYMTSSAFAGEIFLKNEFYRDGKPGFIPFVRLTTTDSPNYNKFVNGRFGYSIYVPREFTIAKFPANSAGCSFEDEYGSAFSVYGMHNSIGQTIEQAYSEDLAKHPNYALADKGSEWYAISYLDNGRIVYKKCFINANYINTWSFVYPQWLGERYNPKCAEVEPTFVPGWKTGNKIWG